MSPRTKDFHSEVVELGITTNGDRLKVARRVITDDPTVNDLRDFEPMAANAGEEVFVANKAGGIQGVPVEWTTEDEVGVVRVRGNLGYRWATDAEISDYHEEFSTVHNDDAVAVRMVSGEPTERRTPLSDSVDSRRESAVKLTRDTAPTPAAPPHVASEKEVAEAQALVNADVPVVDTKLSTADADAKASVTEPKSKP